MSTESDASQIDGACTGHLVVLPDPSTPSGYPDCACKADPSKPLCDPCSALVLAVEAQRPCPDGGLHYGDNVWYPAVCVHAGDEHLVVLSQ